MRPMRSILSALVALALLPALPAIAAGDPVAGKAKSSMCGGCHEIPGLKSVFPTVYAIPKIINQKPEYIEYALQQYRSGERSHPSMASMGMTLTDEDIADLAAYYGNWSEHQ